jgi:putative heme-binding domain-containing protein
MSFYRLCGRGCALTALFLIQLAIAGRICRAQTADDSSHFFLPQNPKAAAYVLGRLSNDELIKAPRGEFVYTALLERAGLASKYRAEALAGLASLRHTDQTTELLRSLTELDQKGEESTNVLRDLGAILLQSPSADLSAKTATLKQMAIESQLHLTRQIAWAACVIAESAAAPSWQAAASNPDQLSDLLSAIPLLPRPELRELFYAPIQELMRPNVPRAQTEAAVLALVSMPAHQAEAFTAAASRIQGGEETAVLVTVLARIPPEKWPKTDLAGLAQTILQYLEQTPPEKRGSTGFSATLEFASELASHLPADDAKTLVRILHTLGPTIVPLRAVYEQMRFDQERIVVETGKPVIITLQNDDAMPHNLAILRPGTLKVIGTAAEKMPATPDAQGRLYVPDSPDVLHATRLVPPGQKLQLSFNAPDQPDDYPYVCTFPGHWLRMSGVLKVVPDFEAYLAAHPVSEQPKLTEWKLSDFAADLGNAEQGRNLPTGKELFTKLACIQCHRLGSDGYTYGPELTDVFKRYKNARAQVLQQILEPSLLVDPKFRNIRFDLADGDSAVGIILKEDDQTVTIQTGPADSLTQVLQKSQIKSRREQTSSPMPVGLLNALSKPQVFDLLAYVENGGQIPAHEHHHAGDNAATNH